MHLRPSLAFLTFLTALPAQGWTNSGGNAARNGLRSDVFGPVAPIVRWSTAPSSIIAWQPVVEGNRVFSVRQLGFPPAGEPNGSPIVCQDLANGSVLWTTNLPFNTGDWTTWIAGIQNGRLFAARSGNGASVAAKLHAREVVTGASIWISQATIDAGAYDGVVFAQNGDLVVASFRTIWRIRWTDGTTAWSANRLASVSGNCGAALWGPAVYVADAAPGGTVVKRYDLATGAFQYQSPVLSGFTVQNSPFVGPDGKVYLARTQNNTSTDFLYCLGDSGTALTTLWQRPAAWTTSAEFAVGDHLFHVAPGGFVEKVTPSGVVAATATVSIGTGALTPRMALDRDGRLFVSNGQFPTGQVFCFEPDLRLRWSVAAPNVNIGAPAIADDGTLLVALTGTSVVAYHTPSPFQSLPGGFGGPSGAPVLTGTGTLTAGRALEFGVTRGPANGIAALVIGAAVLQQPILGGVFVPRPDAVLPAAFALDGLGKGTVGFTWPVGTPFGTKLWYQSWMPDASSPFGISATNGLAGAGQ